MSSATSWPLYVTGIGLWADGFPTVHSWLSGEQTPGTLAPKHHGLNRQCSRRASTFAKTMAACFWEATEQAQIDRRNASIIFGSSLGETAVMFQLLEQMLVSPEDFSPMLFAVSVHNAASGLVSISNQNQTFTTSVAADYDTPAMAIWEALGAIHTHGQPAVVVCGDEATPRGLVADNQQFVRAAAALVLESQLPQPGRCLASLTDLRPINPQEDALRPVDLPPTTQRNPQIGFIDLVSAIAYQTPGRVRLDHGEGHGWSVQVCPKAEAV